MTEQELVEQIAKDLMLNYAHRSAKEQALVSLALIKDAGYRLPTGKAPLMTDEELWHRFGSYRYGLTLEILRATSEAQNDADNKWYGGKE